MAVKVRIRDTISRIIGYNNFTKINLLRRGGLEYLPIINYADITGWFTPREAIALFDLAKKLPDKNPVVCEIGSFQGRSSLILAKAIISKENPVLYCVDPFNADGDQTSIKCFQKVLVNRKIDLKEKFMKNMRKNSVNSIIRVLKGYSHEVVKVFRDKLDLLLIDGNHDCDAVLQDFYDWSKFIKRDGFIVFHDVTEPGVTMALKRGILDSKDWKIILQVNSLLIAKKMSN